MLRVQREKGSVQLRLLADFVLSISAGADMQTVPEERLLWRRVGSEDGEEWKKNGGTGVEEWKKNGGTGGEEWKKNGGAGVEEVEKESLMMELTRLVQKMVKESSWWERRGIDCSILAAAFLCLPPGE